MYDLKTTFFSAIARKRDSASPSVRGAPRAMGDLRRIAAGTTASISDLREAKPSASSIARCSSASGPIWRRSKAAWSSSSGRVWRALARWGVSGMAAFPRAASGRGGFFVGGGVEELLDVGGVGGVDAEHPRGGGGLVYPLRRARALPAC